MILYYSGTGNSAHAALRIAAATGDEALNLFSRIRSGDVSPLRSDSPWVVVTPTYAWRLPRITEDFLSRTPLQGSREIYFILTCGDSVGNAAHYARRLCAQKSLRFRGLAKIVMPENYIAMFNAPGEAEARQIVAKADEVIDAAARRIASGEELSTEKPSLMDRLISGPVNPVFYRFFVKDRAFRAESACTGCGLCAKRCPMNNITIEDDKPAWHGSCTHCMACICSCPAHAIEYSKASTGKPRYRCPE